MIESYIRYLGWAFLQHLMVGSLTFFMSLGFFEFLSLDAYMFAFPLFVIAHYKNPPLMVITGLLAGSFYLLIFAYYAYYMVVPLILVHAAGGTFLNNIGLEMRVVWSHPNWKVEDNFIFAGLLVALFLCHII